MSLPEAKFVQHRPHTRPSHTVSAIQQSPSLAPGNDGESQQVRHNRMERGGRTDGRTTPYHEHVLRRTATPTGLLLCRPRTGRRSNQSPCFRGTRSWGKRSSMKGCVRTHTCNRGQGQVGWSVCRTRSETGVKAMRAPDGAPEAALLE